MKSKLKSNLTKITLAISLAYAAFPAFADSATITSTGFANEAAIEQTGTTGAIALINQNGASNVVGNSGFNSPAPFTPGILQKNSINVSASVNQTGTFNNGAITQINAFASSAAIGQLSIFGDPSSNTATTFQTGSGHTATVSQQAFGVGGLFARNLADVTQSGTGHDASIYNNAFSATALINQTGGQSRAKVSQLNIHQSAFVTQAGFAHQADISQGTGNNQSALVDQDGIDHVAKVEQTIGNDMTAQIRQAGGLIDGNTAIIKQTSSFSFAGILQLGDLLNATIEQYDGFFHTSHINQFGFDQVAGTLQYMGQNDLILVNQSGLRNIASVNQSRVNDSRVELVQHGDGLVASDANRAILSQVGNGASSNDIILGSQLGAANFMSVGQAFSFNTALVDQIGFGNVAYVNQISNASNAAEQNYAAISQNGVGFYASIAQSGNSNHGVIIQH